MQNVRNRAAPAPDIRLIACDLDGTLLRDDHTVPPDFWPLAEELHRRGIAFCPTSGRQYENQLALFAPIAERTIFIAENGSVVIGRGSELLVLGMPEEVVPDLVRTARTLQHHGRAGCVLSGRRSAYIEWGDPKFRDAVALGYLRLDLVPDLLAVRDVGLKMAFFDFVSSERMIEPAFARFRDRVQVVVTGEHWLDIMPLGVNKAVGVRAVQEALGVSREETMVIGDYLNDLEMMDAGDWSFAMANAHPALLAKARFRAPSNREGGALQAIRALVGIP
jgi:Cof subfamily protein (haloacid dehalogenase superfamily)